MNTPEGAAGELATDDLWVIQNNDQVKDKYKARINKGKKCQNNLKEALKVIFLTAGDLYRYSVSTLSKDIWEYKK